MWPEWVGGQALHLSLPLPLPAPPWLCLFYSVATAELLTALLLPAVVSDPYIFGTAGASGFHWCFVRLQQSSFRLFIARSIISTLTVSPYGGLR